MILPKYSTVTEVILQLIFKYNLINRIEKNLNIIYLLINI